MPASSEAPPPPHLVAALILATLTVSTVATLGTPLIPTIAREQGVSLESAQWVLTITLLTGTVATPTLGRLGDGARRRNVLAGTLAAVLIGCVIAATSHSFAQTLVGRALQGVGWGAAPIAVAIAREHLEGQRLRRTIGLISVLVAVGAGLGFPVTALIAQLFGFHAAFWWGVAFSAASLTAVLLAVPAGTPGARRPRLDVTGAILLGAALGTGLIAVSRAETWGWGSPPVLGLGAASLVLLAIFTAVELRREAPLVDVRIVTQRTVMGANLTALLVGMSVYIGMSLVNRLAQTPVEVGYGFGASLVVTGLLLMPLSLGSLASQPLAAALATRLGYRGVLAGGGVVVAITLLMLSASHAYELQIALTTALLGVGVGATFAAMPTLIVASVPPGETGSATSVNQVFRTVGGGIGSALGATLLTASTVRGATYPAEHGYVVAFAVGGAVSLVAAAATFLLVPRMGGDRRSRGGRADLALMAEESASGAGIGPAVLGGDPPPRP